MLPFLFIYFYTRDGEGWVVACGVELLPGPEFSRYQSCLFSAISTTRRTDVNPLIPSAVTVHIIRLRIANLKALADLLRMLLFVLTVGKTRLIVAVLVRLLLGAVCLPQNQA